MPLTGTPAAGPPQAAGAAVGSREDHAGADELETLRLAVAQVDAVDLSQRPDAFEEVNRQLVAALRAVDDD